MCGLVGYCAVDVDVQRQKELVVPLCREAKIRGLHAFGASWFDLNDGEVLTVKSMDLDNVLNVLSTIGTFDLMFHARYSTSGDWRDMSNNQPISVAGYTLAFNGVIDMRTKEEMEEVWGLEMETANDGELFIRHVASGGCGGAFVEQHGSFAGLWYDDEGLMYALRNEDRPLWYVEGDGFVLFASTRDIIERGIGASYAARANECEPGKVYHVTEMVYALA